MVAHALEHPRRHIHGHVPYGQAILLNPETTTAADFAVLEDDTSEDKSYSIVALRGVTFICAYFIPNATRDWLEEKLDACTSGCFADTPTIMMGDLNARHIAWGDRISNTYGNLLVEDMEGYGLRRLEPATGRWSFIDGTNRSIPDHVLTNGAASATTGNLRVLEDEYTGGSEHRLLVFETEAVDGPKTMPAAPRTWNRTRMKDAAVCEEMRQHCGARLDALHDRLSAIRRAEPVAPAQQLVDETEAAIREWIEDGLHACVGRTPRTSRSWASRYWTRELSASLKIVEHHFQRWSAAKDDSSRSQRLWETYLAHRRAHDQLAAARKNEMFRNFCDSLQAMQAGEQQRVISSMRRKRGRAKGALLKTDPAALQSYREHYASQFVNTQPQPEEPAPATGPDTPSPAFCFDAVLTNSAVRAAIGRLAKGKASGESGLPAEALQIVAQEAAEPLVRLFKLITAKHVVPSNWCRARIHPVPKKGDLTKIGNYRPISLTEVMRKLFESLILPCLTDLVEPLSVEQGGFRAKRGTLDQLATLQEWIAQSKHAKAERYLAFLDIKAAYDQVDREILWRKLLSRRVPTNFVSVLQALFDHNEAFIAINGNASAPFPIRSGVLQGSLISPQLYSVFIDDVAEAINDAGIANGLPLGGRQYRLLLYADDIVLMSNSRRAMQAMLDICSRHASLNRYRYGVAKCELLASAPIPDTQPLTLSGLPLAVSKRFTYLGCTFSSDGVAWADHWTRMGVKALSASDALNSAGCNGHGFGVAIGLRTFRTFVRPILEYGLALCPAREATLPLYSGGIDVHGPLNWNRGH